MKEKPERGYRVTLTIELVSTKTAEYIVDEITRHLPAKQREMVIDTKVKTIWIAASPADEAKEAILRAMTQQKNEA